MKKLLLTLTALTLCLASCKNETKMETDTTVANDTIVETEEVVPEAPMDSIAMQQAWEAYMTPGKAHEMMAADVGSWKCDMTFWMDPSAPPQKATSTAKIEMILGGRYQHSTYTGNMMGMDFEGRATLAYDNASEEFISTFIDNMGTGMMVLRGGFDEGSSSSTLTGEFMDPITGKMKNIREVYTVVDENTRKMEMFETVEGGEEAKTMEIVMTRG